MIRRLYAPDHGFFVHYNSRSSDSEFRRLTNDLREFKNVKLLARQKCLWGDSGIVRAAISGIQALACQDFIYDYAILLTGQDYPIKSDVQIRQRLVLAAGGSFMEATAWPIPVWEKGRAIKRIENFHIHLPVPPWMRSLGWQPMWQHLTIPMKRRIPGGLHPHFGSTFWCLHRSCLQYIHEYVLRHSEYLRFFQHAMLPDECLIQTLLMNSEFAASIASRSLTFVEWRPPWPGILTLEDLPRLQQSDCLFARKFDTAADGKILDQLDVISQAA